MKAQHLTGSEEGQSTSPGQQAVSPANADGLREATNVKRTSLQEALGALIAIGQVARIGAGRKGDPYRYYVLTGDRIHSATAPSMGRQNEAENADRLALTLLASDGCADETSPRLLPAGKDKHDRRQTNLYKTHEVGGHA